MCGLFGFSDPKHTLTQKQIRRLTTALATASEQRGTDASGIAYVQGQSLRIYKRPRPAHEMTWLVPLHTTAVMGHTRMTTQGDGTFNPNNHPFPGVSGQTRFALAHNGVLHNDDELKERYHLPKTNIRTDSYVAVQLLEQDGRLDAETIGNAASLLEGTFSLSVLDQFNNLYLIKGNSPLCIYRFENGLLCYASTADILKEALSRCGFLSGSKEIIGISEGDILCIRPDGRLQMSRFDTTNLNKRLRWWNCGDYYFFEPKQNRILTDDMRTPLDELLETACNMGFIEDDILMLLEGGFCEEEIEAMLNSPGLFYRTLMEEIYAPMEY